MVFSSVNRLSSLPRGLGTASGLEILDLTYNNLNEKSLPGNFSVMSKWHVQWSVCKCAEIHFDLVYFSFDHFGILPSTCDSVFEFCVVQTSQPANNTFIFSWFCRLSLATCKLLFITFAEQLRALYLGDNDFETLPPEIGELRNLQVVINNLMNVY